MPAFFIKFSPQPKGCYTWAMLTANITSFFSVSLAQVNWASPSWDFYVLTVAIILALLYGFLLGRDRVIAIMVAIYMALAVVENAPFLKNVTQAGVGQIFSLKTSTFVALAALFFFLLSHTALTRTVVAKDTGTTFWQMIVFSVLHIGLLISIVLSFIPADLVIFRAPLTQQIFMTDTAKFLWIILPLIAMIFLGKGSDRRA